MCAEHLSGTKKPPEGGFFALLTAHPLQTAGDGAARAVCLKGQAASARAFTLADRRLFLNSDPARLRVILSNLISNAIKYSDPSKLDCFVKVTCKEYPLLLEIEVEDNGIGISAEHHKRIFDSYYKLSDRSDSNGLGLSNVKDAVQKLQGTIEVESTLGLGSIFKIQLPAI